jgi:DNA polymerase III sliding clamp (beta) subunit (PCNA family)
MDFLIQRDELLRALNRAVAIVDKRPANAILACVLVQATTTGVRFVATDKTITFLGDFDANVRTPGEAAVDATNFFQTARVLPAGAVHVRLVDGQRIEVRAIVRVGAVGSVEPKQPDGAPALFADRHGEI